MKAVLISVQPKWCELIASGKKTVEVRKTKPKIDEPFKCYIYCTNSSGTLHSAYDGLHYHKSYIGKNDSSCINGKVIGEFVCYKIETIGWISNPSKADWKDGFNKETCLTNRETYEYTKGKLFYEWHISDLVIYDKPKELSEFRSYNVSTYIDEEFGLPMPTYKIKRPPQSYMYVEKLR